MLRLRNRTGPVSSREQPPDAADVALTPLSWCHLREKELLPLLKAFEGCRKPGPQHGLGVHRADVRDHTILKLSKELLLHRFDVRQPQKGTGLLRRAIDIHRDLH